MGWIQAQANRVEGNYRQQQAASSWSRPILGRIKLNVDAAVRDSGCGLGWCLWDERGRFVTGVACPREGKLSPLAAELIGIRETLSWLQDYEWVDIDMESDSSCAISEILKGTSDSSIGVIAGDIRNLSRHFSSISFSHVKRSANKSVHALARATCSVSEQHTWFFYPPSFFFMYSGL
ncbi:unnamed protein product [Cuscuta europaea]|uniref:RNase H type-1 domain-containing protein n=1 Tax=Cuscuta europaea TaxID=41803 RepID=A0A9P0ZPT2_CUSEU|nr:unnamed protein product [Cuscuta europaea]